MLEHAILSGARENVDIELNIREVRNRLEDASAKKGSVLTEVETATLTKSILATKGSKLRSIPEDKLMRIPDDRLEQALTADSITTLRDLWAGAAGGVSFGAGITTGYNDDTH